MRLLTFAIVGPHGVGVATEELTQEYYLNSCDKDIADKYAFRSILAKELDVELQVDFSISAVNDSSRFFTNY